MVAARMKAALSPVDLSSMPAPQEAHNWRLYAMAMSASCASAAFGYDSAFVGGAISLPSFKRRFAITAANSTATSSHLTSLFQAGCFFGALLVYPITERYGRRPALIVAGIVFCIGAIIQTVADGNIGMMYAGRVLAGLGVGSSSLVTPNYISECSIPALRGRLVGLFEVVLQTALVFGFWVNYGVDKNIPDNGTDKQWRIPFALQLIPGGLLIICMLFQSESPRWLIKRGRIEDARTVLCRLRHLESDHPYIGWEIQAVEKQIADELGPLKDASFARKLRETFAAKNRTRLGLGVALMWLQNLSGINALNYFSNTLIKGIGFTGTSVSLLATGVYGLVKMIATVIFMFFVIDSVGRRKPLIIGSAVALFSMLYLGAYSIHTHSFTQAVDRDGRAYFGLVCIYIFAIGYACSWNGIPWIFQAEVFAMNVRALSMVVTTCSQWLAQFVIVYSAPYMVKSMKGWTFIFFALWIAFALVFAYFFLPETKEISLEDMDILFAGPTSARGKRRYYEEHLARRRKEMEEEAGMKTLSRSATGSDDAPTSSAHKKFGGSGHDQQEQPHQKAPSRSS
ncbi:unnamed protein product [Parajaminaea phylloscopi]